MIGRMSFWGGIFVFCLLANWVKAGSTSIVISQVYGGGGNVGAPYKNDFIELHNKGAIPVDLSGWSMQYADSNNWQIVFLGLSLQPGQYFLIQLAGGNSGA